MGIWVLAARELVSRYFSVLNKKQISNRKLFKKNNLFTYKNFLYLVETIFFKSIKKVFKTYSISINKVLTNTCSII
jgi:hypothetical protein